MKPPPLLTSPSPGEGRIRPGSPASGVRQDICNGAMLKTQAWGRSILILESLGCRNPRFCRAVLHDFASMAQKGRRGCWNPLPFAHPLRNSFCGKRQSQGVSRSGSLGTVSASLSLQQCCGSFFDLTECFWGWWLSTSYLSCYLARSSSPIQRIASALQLHAFSPHRHLTSVMQRCACNRLWWWHALALSLAMPLKTSGQGLLYIAGTKCRGDTCPAMR